MSCVCMATPTSVASVGCGGMTHRSPVRTHACIATAATNVGHSWLITASSLQMAFVKRSCLPPRSQPSRVNGGENEGKDSSKAWRLLLVETTRFRRSPMRLAEAMSHLASLMSYECSSQVMLPSKPPVSNSESQSLFLRNPKQGRCQKT